ncbi:hypothetical protein B0T20DRAFT_498671 [Sordaria brevicollis]|uniref:Uncharacterized protein n=1 Tax=Sordaria brevicollis TaxID=83679 RepID=A0AAE0UC46_SORBR|nr:hypothetical protein B0T20DRAFT_498671 [Sordaria brevicollis]
MASGCRAVLPRAFQVSDNPDPSPPATFFNGTDIGTISKLYHPPPRWYKLADNERQREYRNFPLGALGYPLNGGFHDMRVLYDDLQLGSLRDTKAHTHIPNYYQGEDAFKVVLSPTQPIDDEYRLKDLAALKRQLLPRQTIAFLLSKVYVHQGRELAPDQLQGMLMDVSTEVFSFRVHVYTAVHPLLAGTLYLEWVLPKSRKLIGSLMEEFHLADQCRRQRQQLSNLPDCAPDVPIVFKDEGRNLPLLRKNRGPATPLSTMRAPQSLAVYPSRESRLTRSPSASIRKGEVFVRVADGVFKDP